MLVIVFQQARRKRIRWRFADLCGLIGALLVLLVGINGLPRALYRYDTTESFGGFMAQSILMMLLSAIGAGVLIIVGAVMFIINVAMTLLSKVRDTEPESESETGAQESLARTTQEVPS